MLRVTCAAVTYVSTHRWRPLVWVYEGGGDPPPPPPARNPAKRLDTPQGLVLVLARDKKMAPSVSRLQDSGLEATDQRNLNPDMQLKTAAKHEIERCTRKQKVPESNVGTSRHNKEEKVKHRPAKLSGLQCPVELGHLVHPAPPSGGC